MRERDPKHSTPHGETPYSPTSLLRALTANPYDVEDLRKDEHPAGEAAPPDNRITRGITLLIAVALGFAVAASVIDLRREAAAEDSPRAVIEQEVRQTQEEADALEAQQEDLEAQVAEAQGDVLEGTDGDAAERLSAFEEAGALVPLTGPGTVLVLDDSAPLPASPGVEEGTVNRVTDGDVQVAVNGLWAAGAEAIAVNGQRLTSTSAIRTAGSAVLVDFRPLSPPYRITALGDPEQLHSAFEAGETSAYLEEISSRFGIRSSWEDGEELSVPARSPGTLREATVPEEEQTVPEEDETSAAPTDAAEQGGSEEETP